MSSPGFNLNDYIQVHERLELFRKDHPDWGLLTEITVDDGQRIVIRATITDQSGRFIATGHAEEVRGSSPVNRTSAVENAETSAWGRALANLGYEVKRGVASREEMEKVQRMQQQAPAPVGNTKPVGQVVQKVEGMAKAASEIAVKRAQRIHIAAKDAGIDEEKLRTRMAQINHGDTSAKALNDQQAQALLQEIAEFVRRKALRERGVPEGEEVSQKEDVADAQ